MEKKEFIKYIFSLDASRGLSSQGLFWLAILVPFIYFLVLGGIVWQDYTLCLDAKGFQTFTSISALPLGVLSLMIPLSVSVARFHTSKQTAKQIAIVSQKNNIDLFHSHRKELFSYFTQVGETKYSDTLKGKNHVHPRLHKNFFIGKPESGAPIPNSKTFEQVGRDINSLLYLLQGVVKNINKERSYDFYIANFCPATYSIAMTLGLIEILTAFKATSLETIPSSDGVKYTTVGKSTEDAFVSARYILDFYKNLCDFAGFQNGMDFIDKEYISFLESNKYKNIQPKVIEEIIGVMELDKKQGQKKTQE